MSTRRSTRRKVPPHCGARWPGAPSKGRPDLACEYAPQHEGYHFDGTFEVLWSTLAGHPEQVGADRFAPPESSR